MSKNGGGEGLRPHERSWLWRRGTSSWLLLGMVGIIVVAGAAYSRAHQVLLPLIVAVIVGILLEPLVLFLTRHHFPRWLAVLITMILIIAVVGIASVIVYGISTQAGAIEQQVEDGVNKINDWFESHELGNSVVKWIHKTIDEAWPSIQGGLMERLAETVPGIASFLVGVFMGFFILIFILGDDGTLRNWVAGHMGVPREHGEAVLQEVTVCVRGYFRGTTTIAFVDTALVVPMVLILKMPLLGPIALVTFVTCFIPSFGGYIGGGFAIFIAIASRGLVPGIIMLVYAIIVHTILQNPVQAVAYGKTLQMHPLLALLVTLFGAVFAGIAGAILAVPITAVVIKMVSLLRGISTEGELSGSETAAPLPESSAPPLS
ncbi:MAG: AI-2E family transporter [Actinomycetota bacterium]|nr:AI-2E family transporter [Actinomycetota bacterium]